MSRYHCLIQVEREVASWDVVGWYCFSQPRPGVHWFLSDVFDEQSAALMVDWRYRHEMPRHLKAEWNIVRALWTI